MPDQVTPLTEDEKRRFRLWARTYNIRDVNPEGEVYPESNYDMQGYWKENQGPRGIIGEGPVHFPRQHYPDTYKQTTHPTFSQESQYSTGPSQGGMWVGENKDTLLKQPKMAVSHTVDTGLSKKYNPIAAAQKAKGIGPSQVGERYTETEGPSSIPDIVKRYMFGTEGKPPSVAAQDPYGIGQWEKTGGMPPGMPLVTAYATPEERAIATNIFKVGADQIGGNVGMAMHEFAQKYPRIAAHIDPKLGTDPSPTTRASIQTPIGQVKGPMEMRVTPFGMQMASEEGIDRARNMMYHEGTHAAQALGNKDFSSLYPYAQELSSYTENPFEINARVAGQKAGPTTSIGERRVNVNKSLSEMAHEASGTSRGGYDKGLVGRETQRVLKERGVDTSPSAWQGHAAEREADKAARIAAEKARVEHNNKIFEDIQRKHREWSEYHRKEGMDVPDIDEERTVKHPIFGKITEKDAKELVGGGELPMSWYEKNFPSPLKRSKIDVALTKRGIPSEVQESFKEEQFNKATNKPGGESPRFLSPMQQIAEREGPGSGLAPPRKGKVTYSHDRGTTTIDYDNPLPNGALPTEELDLKGNKVPFHEYTHPIEIPWVEANHVNRMKRTAIDVSPSETFNRR